MASMRRRAALYALICLAGLGLAAVLVAHAARDRSGNSTAVDPIRRAAEQTAASGPTSFSWESHISVPGPPGFGGPVSVTGTVDAANHALEVDGYRTIRSIAGMFYVKAAELKLPAGVEWVSFRQAEYRQTCRPIRVPIYPAWHLIRRRIYRC